MEHDVISHRAGRVTRSLVGFCRFAREQGLPVGIQETLDALSAARVGMLRDKETFRLAARALLCTSKAERDLFDLLFDAYWAGTPTASRQAPKQRRGVDPTTVEQQVVPLLMIGTQAEAPPEEEGQGTAGASVLERLRQTDFSTVPPHDQDQLERLAQRLWKQMNVRLAARRLQATRLKRQVNLRRTIRRNIPHGGDLIELRYKGKKPRKPRLVVLLDVSGSMDQYSFFLVRFVYALQRQFSRVESFVFSTRLTRITRAMKTHTLPDSLAALAETAEGWSSGTRIGACLQTFNETHAKRILSKNTLVLILSDGLDTGEPEALAEALHALKRRAKKIIWMTPLLGMADYQPLTRGIQAVLPLVDVFISAHNLDSLLQLERYLIDV